MKGSMNMNRATRRHNLYIIPVPLGRVSSQWRGAPVFKFKKRTIRDAVIVIILLAFTNEEARIFTQMRRAPAFKYKARAICMTLAS